MEWDDVRIAAGTVLVLYLAASAYGIHRLHEVERCNHVAGFVARHHWDVVRVERTKVRGVRVLQTQLASDYFFESSESWKTFYILLNFRVAHPDYETVSKLGVGQRISLAAEPVPIKALPSNTVEAYLRLALWKEGEGEEWK
jgi:hypothetical protein